MLRYGQDQEKLYKLYREVVESGTLYWLGDVLKPAQLRVCKADNVKAPPDNDQYWEDFFVLRDDVKLKEQTVGEFQRITDGQFGEHLSAYHPESYPGFDADSYMASDFSNASLVQRYDKPQIRAMDGLDTVKKFVCKRYGDNSVKWFRIWSSGFLEHGGTVDVENPAGKDTDEYGHTKGEFFTVGFDWQYDNNLAAPTFDYQSGSIEGFHFADSQITTGTDDEKVPYDDTAELAPSPRYVVSLTPHNTGDAVYASMDDRYGVYNTKEVLSIKNKSFTFVVNRDCRYYSYYASGFTTNVAKRF